MLLDFRSDYYGEYLEFKAWDEKRDPGLDEIFAIEIARAGAVSPAAILEVGFGYGHFLDWAAERGYRITGVEIIETLVERARERGHRAFCGMAHQVPEIAQNRFELIVAFDVLEHLLIDEITALLRFAKAVLTPHGRFLARFPNGASPFGAFYQSGDITHVTALSPSRVKQIAAPVGLELVGSFNAARPLMQSRRPAVLTKARYAARDLIEFAIGNVYYGKRVPLDPNVTVVLQPAA
jgi:2-polyprenyl-3-methyl-5-hydroxy-6-metoxy-1,4-benzoquinol methylase